ncbi:MAG TPA: hypothetical protein PLT49_04230, partial [Ferruginibacter sp.]|nr:hypothetical protein [Ferruginibacter sp.]
YACKRKQQNKDGNNMIAQTAHAVQINYKCRSGKKMNHPPAKSGLKCGKMRLKCNEIFLPRQPARLPA